MRAAVCGKQNNHQLFGDHSYIFLRKQGRWTRWSECKMKAIDYEMLLLPGCSSLFSTATSVGSTGSGFQRWLHAQRVSPATRPGSVKGTNSQVPQLNPSHPNSTRAYWKVTCSGVGLLILF